MHAGLVPADNLQGTSSTVACQESYTALQVSVCSTSSQQTAAQSEEVFDLTTEDVGKEQQQLPDLASEPESEEYEDYEDDYDVEEEGEYEEEQQQEDEEEQQQEDEEEQWESDEAGPSNCKQEAYSVNIPEHKVSVASREVFKSGEAAARYQAALEECDGSKKMKRDLEMLRRIAEIEKLSLSKTKPLLKRNWSDEMKNIFTQDSNHIKRRDQPLKKEESLNGGYLTVAANEAEMWCTDII